VVRNVRSNGTEPAERGFRRKSLGKQSTVSQLNLNLLTALDALLQEVHVTRAADRAGLSQPAMSRALRRLRVLLGDDLLVRVSNNLFLTPFATALAPTVHEAVESVQQVLRQRSNFDASTDSHSFSIAASDYAAIMLYGQLSAQIERDAPNVSLSSRQLSTETFNELKNGQLDIVLGRTPEGFDFPNHVLFEDRWVCAVGVGNTEVKDSLTMAEFLRLPHLNHQLGTGLPAMADVALEHMGKTPWNILSIESFFILPFLIKDTRFVVLIPELMGKRISEAAEIRLIEPPFKLAPIILTMSWHPRSNNDPAHEWLRRRLARIGSGISTAGDEIKP